MAAALPQLFSIAIFKNSLPSFIRTIDVVEAVADFCKQEFIECVQPINGLIKIVFKRCEPKRELLNKGLSIGGKIYQVIDWIEGMDAPQVKVCIDGLPHDLDHGQLGTVPLGYHAIWVQKCPNGYCAIRVPCH